MAESRGAARLGEPKPIVLVADDEPIVVEVVERYLRREGFRVVTASTADEAWQAARSPEAPPDAIVLDVMLPGGDGMDICRRLREQDVAVPIVLLTARGEEADRVSGLNVCEEIGSPHRSAVDVARKRVWVSESVGYRLLCYDLGG